MPLPFLILVAQGLHEEDGASQGSVTDEDLDEHLSQSSDRLSQAGKLLTSPPRLSLSRT
jgi:hypothetical protein